KAGSDRELTLLAQRESFAHHPRVSILLIKTVKKMIALVMIVQNPLAQRLRPALPNHVKVNIRRKLLAFLHEEPAYWLHAFRFLLEKIKSESQKSPNQYASG